MVPDDLRLIDARMPSPKDGPMMRSEVKRISREFHSRALSFSDAFPNLYLCLWILPHDYHFSSDGIGGPLHFDLELVFSNGLDLVSFNHGWVQKLNIVRSDNYAGPLRSVRGRNHSYRSCNIADANGAVNRGIYRRNSGARESQSWGEERFEDLNRLGRLFGKEVSSQELCCSLKGRPTESRATSALVLFFPAVSAMKKKSRCGAWPRGIFFNSL